MRIFLLALMVAVAAPAFAAAPAAKKAAPAAAPAKVVPVTNASEAVTLFRRLCIDTKGDRSITETALKPFVDGGVAKKLPKDASKQFTGHDSLATWILASPTTKQKLMADYDSKGVCALYVNQADAKEMRALFKKMVTVTAAELKANVATKSEPKKIGDNTIQFDFFEIIRAPDQPRIAVSLSTSPKPVGDTQHYMTYTIIAPKKK